MISIHAERIHLGSWETELLYPLALLLYTVDHEGMLYSKLTTQRRSTHEFLEYLYEFTGMFVLLLPIAAVDVHSTCTCICTLHKVLP